VTRAEFFSPYIPSEILQPFERTCFIFSPGISWGIILLSQSRSGNSRRCLFFILLFIRFTRLYLISHFYPITPYIYIYIYTETVHASWRYSWRYFSVISHRFGTGSSPSRQGVPSRVTLSRSHIHKHRAAGNRRFTGKRRGDKPGNQLALTRFTRFKYNAIHN